MAQQLANIVIGRFQPLTTGHIKCAEYVKKTTGIPTVFCIIDTPEDKVDEKKPFPTDMLLPDYEKLINKDIIGFVRVKNADIVSNAELMREAGFEPTYWSCGSDRFQSYVKMVDRYRDKAQLGVGFRVIEIPRTDDDVSASKVRECLKKDDEKGFRKLMPFQLWKMYDKLKQYIK